MHINEQDRDALLKMYEEWQETGSSKYPNMSYEDGIYAMLAVLDGDALVEEIT